MKISTKEELRMWLHTDACLINMHQHEFFLLNSEYTGRHVPAHDEERYAHRSNTRRAYKKTPIVWPVSYLLDLVIKSHEMFGATLYRSIHHNETFRNNKPFSATTYVLDWSFAKDAHFLNLYLWQNNANSDEMSYLQAFTQVWCPTRF